MPTSRYGPTRSPTVRMEIVSTPGTLGTRYGSVVVLGPMLVGTLGPWPCARAARDASRVGPAISKGAVARAPLRKERRELPRSSASCESVIETLRRERSDG